MISFLNIYKAEFFAFCPVNEVRVQYRFCIETDKVIKVEEIIDEITLHNRGFHEDIADQLHRTFGGKQTLTAHHHGVDIETIRGSL
jgi:hypothetical protein